MSITKDTTHDGASRPSPALSLASTLVEGSPQAPVRHRPPFTRLSSVVDESQHKYAPVQSEDDITNAPAHPVSSTHGLGISFDGDFRPTKTSASNTPPIAGPEMLLKPSYDYPISHWSSSHIPGHSVTSFQSSTQQTFACPSESQPLKSKQSFADTLRLHHNG